MPRVRRAPGGFIPPGRLDDLRDRPDADRIGYTVSGLFTNYQWTVYKSRHALSCFATAGSTHHALIKALVHPTMLTNPNMQRPESTT